MVPATSAAWPTTPPQEAHPKILALYRYWQSLAPGKGRLPGRKAIDPVQIPPLLENIWLVEFLGAKRRFRVRLIGDALHRMGFALKRGDYLEDFMQDQDLPLRQFRFLAESGKPIWFRGAAYAPHATMVSELERLSLPLATDGVTVDGMLSLTVFYTLDGKDV